MMVMMIMITMITMMIMMTIITMITMMIYTQGKCLLGTCNGKDFFLYSSISSQNAPLLDDDNLTIKSKFNNNVRYIVNQSKKHKSKKKRCDSIAISSIILVFLTLSLHRLSLVKNNDLTYCILLLLRCFTTWLNTVSG
jgi:hypothetical protein